MHSWPIGRVFLNGASMYDHEQTDMYRRAMNAKNRNLEKAFFHIKQPVREGMLTFHQRKKEYSLVKQYMKYLQNHVVRGIVYNRFLDQKSKQFDQNYM